MGFSTYACDDCHYSYIADYTDPLGHDYAELVVPPTCTEIGYSVFTCSRCGDEYVGNEKAKKPHDYEAKVTEPTCTELGHTDYVCKTCGDTYSSDYVEAKGHNNSDWIIDVPSTIEHDGSRHIECTVCGEVLKTEVIPHLSEKDNSDEDGHSVVGDYNVLVTDKDGKPVFNNEISIDTIGNISIRMPEGRLISAEDMTTVTVTYTETKQPAEGVRIFISDHSDNAATGTTNENGQLTVPNSSSSTGNSNGTVSDGTNTYVVVVTDKDGSLIPNCDVTAGENYSIDVKLPNGTEFNRDNRITVTVVTEHGKPVSDLRVQVIGDGDYIENGCTNVNGQVTLPVSNTDVTDGNGNAEVGDRDGDKVYDFIVTVSDETELIENALVTLIAKDNSVLVCLPEGKKIDYYNRTTVKVTRSDGTAVEGWKVTVYNKDGSNIRTEMTDENGIVIVPPLSEAPIANPTPSPEPDADATPLPGVDATAAPQATTNPDATAAPTSEPDMGDGSVVENRSYKYRVFVWDNDGVIKSFGLIKLQDDGSIRIELPENKYLDVQNKVHIRVINENDGAPVKGITVNVTDPAGTSASDITNSSGIAIVPVSDSDYTDGNGNAQIKDNEGNIYNVNVKTEKKGNIENAFVQVTDGKIIVVLPDGTVIDYSDRTTVTVTDRDNAPVAELPVNVKDNNGGDRTENTDENGKAVVPPTSEAYTDKDGKAKAGDYTIIVEDTKTKIENAFVEIKDGKISVLLPDGHTLVTSNQTTVTVLDNTDAPVKGMSVTVTDTNAKTATKTTDAKGKVTVPAKTSGGGGGGSSRGGGSSSSSYVTYNINVTDKNGKSVPATKSTTANGITVTLPKSYGMTDNYYTITVNDSAGKSVEGRNVTLRDYEGKNSADGKTDKDGTVILPATEHAAYVIGYEDGTFRPEGSMTRAEAAAIFARNIAERKSEVITNNTASFTDVESKLWYNQYICYLEKYDIINGYADGTFRPDAPVTRAEFVAMCTRFYKLFEQMPSTNGSRFNDVSSSHWAYSFINSATAKKWLNGYAAGCMGEQCSEAERPATRSFRPDNSITRAEVVAIVNRVTERRADTEYVNKNLTTVNPFTDMKDKSYWAYYDVIEAANEHMAVLGTDSESWVK